MKLKIADDLALPMAAVTEVLGFLGRRGQGKSYAAQKLAELMHEAGAQFVVLDPVGIWYGLRLAADGKRPGIPLPVFGGLHGDVPLEPSAGKLIADVVSDRGISAVLDVSHFESDADKARFATDFGARFYFRRKQAPAAVHLFLEECQEFVPQNPQREETRTLHVYQRIAKLGRNYGIGVSLISQRPQEVHKKVLNLTELLFAFQLTGPHERKAVAGWIQEKGIDEDIDAELPKLKVGAPHAWSPAWLNISRVVQIGQKWTFDASSTPTGKAETARELAPIDLEKLRKDMAATIEKAKADDPRELRKQITELKRQVSASSSQLPAPKVETKTVETFVLKDGQLARLEKLYERIFNEAERHASAIDLFWKQQSDEAKALLNVLAIVAGEQKPFRPADVVPIRTTQAKVTPQVALARRAVPTAESNGDLGKCERAILMVLAQHPEGCESGKLTLLSGYRYSGGFKNSLSALRQAGYMDGQNTGTMRITDAGIAAVGAYDPLPTGAALGDYWLNHPSFGRAERAILESLLQHPKGMTADQLCQSTGYQYSGGFKNSLSALRTAGVMTGRNTETMKADDELFD